MDDVLTTREAAEVLGVGVRRVLQYIADGRLRARRVGRLVWLVRRADLALVRHLPRGRPPKKGPAPKPAGRREARKQKES